ncbi:hypothetical protein HDU96_007562 [Phlyctochytrium bullatum]|nr:hypothetical protein HDU96_007562 [Phlyctochytrium bullatum]
MLVTCYSEGSEGLRTTFDSLANTTYSDKHKLLFIIADGLIVGSGNEKSTPDLILDMLELDSHWPKEPEPQSYLAIVSGSKKHNKAKVYVAWYKNDKAKLPAILVVKCGTAEEQSQPKPGNRGKRDSQIILMNFFKKVMFDEPMTPLEYDLFRKVQFISGVTPDNFEIVLMVDADTKVAPDSLSRMVAAMARDPLVMGLCGETRIANKAESRVIYIYWMLVYLLALPVWNFVLPVYAFWHFDDFSWGQTRMVQGETKDSGHGGNDGKKLDAKAVPERLWADWERERRRAVEALKSRKRKGKKPAPQKKSIQFESSNLEHSLDTGPQVEATAGESRHETKDPEQDTNEHAVHEDGRTQ